MSPKVTKSIEKYLTSARSVSFGLIPTHGRYDAKRAAQSDALQALGDRQTFQSCQILGGQDTLLTGGGATRQYFVEAFINGAAGGGSV